MKKESSENLLCRHVQWQTAQSISHLRYVLDRETDESKKTAIRTAIVCLYEAETELYTVTQWKT